MIKTKQKALTIAIALSILGGVLFAGNSVSAGELFNRTIFPSTSEASANNVNYTVRFNISNSYSLGSIVIEFCDNDPIINTPCIPPSGFDASSVTINSQSGETGFSIDPSSTNNVIVLSRAPALTNIGTVTLVLGGITNPDLGNYAFFARAYTKATSDGTGPETDASGFALSTSNQLAFTTEVPPYLTFCAAITISGFNCNNITGSFIDFGELSSSSPRTATSQFIVGTNADSGFVVYANGSPPTSGNNVINAMSTRQNSNPGSSQFGLNLRRNTNPSVGSDFAGAGTGIPRPDYNVPNQFKFLAGDPIATSPTTTLGRKFTVSYLINVSANQKPGLYSTTLLYIALATF